MYKACLYHSRLEATESKQLFFARKFEPLIHHEIINRIDDWLGLAIGQGGDEERHHYWQNVYHHLGKLQRDGSLRFEVPEKVYG
jgi:hypothetical protein